MQPNIVLLAGGSGSRLWPLSSHNHPKQFITLPPLNFSSFQLSLKRSLAITEAKNIIIISNAEYKYLLYKQISSLNINRDDLNIIFEEYSCNTGIAVYYSCLMLLQQNKHNLTYFCPTDHLISESPQFFENILTRVDAQKINLFGQRIFTPCSNFGYIVAGRNLSYNYYEADRFVEKPDQEKIPPLTNAIFMGYSKIYRNLGIYLSKAEVLYNEFRKLYNNLPSITLNADENEHYIKAIYDNLSIDKMIAERSKLLNLSEIEFEWRDIGSFESLYQSCAGSALMDCEVDPMDISEFNNKNSDFELSYNNRHLQIIKRSEVKRLGG